VFSSTFSEGDANFSIEGSESTQQLGSDLRLPRRRIRMVEDYDTVHNILYYICCDRITLSSIQIEPKEGEPRICHVELIYELAHRLDLDLLQAKVLHFLDKTCTPENITSRVFGRWAGLYTKVEAVYDRYFKTHWKLVCTTRQYVRYFEKLEEEGDIAEMAGIFWKFRELMAR
jgi:hypothetical protein